MKKIRTRIRATLIEDTLLDIVVDDPVDLVRVAFQKAIVENHAIALRDCNSDVEFVVPASRIIAVQIERCGKDT